MACARLSNWGGPLLAALPLATILSGCGSFRGDIDFGSRIGLRPDAPAFRVQGAVQKADENAVDACTALQEYIKYAENVKEAYRTRATQNRTWIYVAAVTGLAVAAASGALAAASGIAAGTLALLAISGGFTSATFATINNSDLANVYTVAANSIGKAIANVEARVTRCPGVMECAGQLAYLTTVLSNARNTLETARTSSAAGALARASAQKTLLDQEISRAAADLKARTAAEVAKRAKADATAATAEHATAKAKADAMPDGDPRKAVAENEVKDKKDAKDKAEANATAAEKAAADAATESDLDSAAKAEALLAVTCL
jgi:trimeric autotransporter adhesin